MTAVDVLVIGGGQAGLAAAYHLRARGLDYLLVDAGERIGDSWRRRYASLTLFTPRQFNALPGFAMQGNRDGYPSRDEFADYLDAYAQRFDLRLRLRTRVARLRKLDDGSFEALAESGGRIIARDVIVATGGSQVPIVPDVANSFAPTVVQLTAGSYQAPAQLPEGTVLVVRDGASGRDIAAELAASHRTYLAAGKPRRLFPERLFGKSIWWWLNLLGVLRAGPHTRIGRRIRSADAFPDRDRSIESLRRLGVTLVPRLIRASGASATFQDGVSAGIATVVWAVGYRDESAWVELSGATDANGNFLHEAGASPVAGLYFVGRPWQRNRASALVMCAGPDAGHIVARIMATTGSR